MTNDQTAVAIARIGPRRLAEAIMSPSSLLLGGAVGGAAIAAFGPAGILVGGLAWLTATARRLRRAPVLRGAQAPSEIDPFAISDPWRSSVIRAVNAQGRFDRAIQATARGGVRDRLASIREKVQSAVEQSWTIAVQGDQLDDAVRELDVRSQQSELYDAEAELQRNRDPARHEVLQGRRDAVRSQLESAQRLVALSQSTEDRLAKLNAQLDELVARGIELSVTGSVDDLTDLGAGVDSVLAEMEAVRQAMGETTRISRGQTSTATA